MWKYMGHELRVAFSLCFVRSGDGSRPSIPAGVANSSSVLALGDLWGPSMAGKVQ